MQTRRKFAGILVYVKNFQRSMHQFLPKRRIQMPMWTGSNIKVIIMNEEKVLCEKCGSEMCIIDEICTVGMTCPNCGYGWVTSSRAFADTQTYSIFLDSNKNSIDNIKLISSIANCNYLMARKLIGSSVPFFCGSAIKVKSIKKELDDAGIRYRIEPEFPY